MAHGAKRAAYAACEALIDAKQPLMELDQPLISLAEPPTERQERLIRLDNLSNFHGIGPI
jgi:hypothetical protein